MKSAVTPSHNSKRRNQLGRTPAMLAMVAAAFSVSACGGGHGVSTFPSPAPAPAPAPSPSPSPTPAPSPAPSPTPSPTSSSYTTKGAIEAKYKALGPLAVSHMVSSASCDRKGNACDIWYPTNLGSNSIKGISSGFKHPVISWANGSGQTPSSYEYYLKHLASWGFVVVASRETMTVNGDTTADAAQYMIGQGNLASSIFFNKIDEANIGAAGHSQGGASVSSLHAHKNPLFKTFVAFHSAPHFFAIACCDINPPETYKDSGVTRSIFQWNSDPDALSQDDWYGIVPAPALKASARLKFTQHADIQSGASPDCPSIFCGQGAHPYLGYSTAWFLWELQGVADAASVFRAGGEFFNSNPNWTSARSNIP